MLASLKASRLRWDATGVTLNIPVASCTPQSTALDGADHMGGLQYHLLLVELFRSFLAYPQNLPSNVTSTVPWRQLYLEIPRDRDECALGQVVVNIVRIWRIGSAGLNSVQAEQTEQGRVDELAGNSGSWT